MLTQIVKWSLLAIFIFDNLINDKQVFANVASPIAFANVSTMLAGSAFTMKCEMPVNYTIGKEEFIMFFVNNISHSWFSQYDMPESTTQQRKRKFYSSLSNKDKPYIASVQPVNSATTVTSNTFEISITTTKNNTFSAQFYCQVYYNRSVSFYSNRLPITTVTTISLSPPTLSSNVSHVSLDHPFTLTCSLPSQFNPHNSAYQVAFFNSRDGMLANYEVDASGKVFLVSKDLANVSVFLGARSAFPTFDLQITEKVDQKLSYWCQLLTVDSTTQKHNISLESTHWKSAGPFVNFSSTITTGVERRGRCSINELTNFSDREYQVLFYSDFGTKIAADNLLCYFWVRPHRVTQFVTETVTHWTTIAHGSIVEYPHFEVIGKIESGSNVAHNKWWCTLNYTEPGQNNVQLIKSNIEAI